MPHTPRIDLTEDDVKKTISGILTMLPEVVWWERLNSGTVKTAWGSWVKMCSKGTPDFIALVSDGKIGHVLFIECKSPEKIAGKNRGQSPEQIEFEENLPTLSNVHYLLTARGSDATIKIYEIADSKTDEKIRSKKTVETD